MFNELISTEEPSTSSEVPAESNTGSATSRMQAASNYFMRNVENFVLGLQEDSEVDLNHLNLRFSTAMNVARFRNTSFCVIGVGGIGSWIVRALVGMGAEDVTIIDDDSVELHNVGPQAFDLVDLGKPKVLATQEAMLRFRGIRIKTIQRRVTGFNDILNDLDGSPDVLIVCVDNMQIRNALADEMFEYAQYYDSCPYEFVPRMYIDLRMTMGSFHAFALPIWAMEKFRTAQVAEAIRYFKRTAMFEDSEALAEPCTERALVYTGAAIAAKVCSLLHWANDNPLQGADELDAFLDVNSELPHHWISTFNSRGWRDGMVQVFTPALQDLMSSTTKKLNEAKQELETFKVSSGHSDSTENMYFMNDPGFREKLQAGTITPHELEVLVYAKTVQQWIDSNVWAELGALTEEFDPEALVWLPVPEGEVDSAGNLKVYLSLPAGRNYLDSSAIIGARKRPSTYGAYTGRTYGVAAFLPVSAGIRPGDTVFYWDPGRSMDSVEVKSTCWGTDRKPFEYFDFIIVGCTEPFRMGHTDIAYIKRPSIVSETNLNPGMLVQIKGLDGLKTQTPQWRLASLKGVEDLWCVICEVVGVYEDQLALIVCEADQTAYHLIFAQDIRGICSPEVFYRMRRSIGELQDMQCSARVLGEYTALRKYAFPNVPLSNAYIRTVDIEDGDTAISEHPHLLVLSGCGVYPMDGIYRAYAEAYDKIPKNILIRGMVRKDADNVHLVTTLSVGNQGPSAGLPIPRVMAAPMNHQRVVSGIVTIIDFLHPEDAQDTEPIEQPAEEEDTQELSELGSIPLLGQNVASGSRVAILEDPGVLYRVTKIVMDSEEKVFLDLGYKGRVAVDQVIGIVMPETTTT